MPRTRGGKNAPAAGPSVKDDARENATPSTGSGGLLATLTAVQEQGATGSPGVVVEDLPLAEIAPHPDNPAHRHEDLAELEDLAADIKADGVLVPAIVATRVEVVRRSPELAKRIDPNTRWVILAGHRRWGASRVAEQTTLPCLIRDDLADPVEIVKVFIRENKKRLAISVIEEAHAYERLRDQKISQREIAAAMKTSQSNISKTLDLLKLPLNVQNSITAGQISPHAARKLLDIPAQRREATYQHAIDEITPQGGEPELDKVDIATAVRREKARIEREENEQTARAQLKTKGLIELDPTETWGTDAWKHQITDENAEAELTNGRVAGAAIEDGQLRYYSSHPTVSSTSVASEQHEAVATSSAPEDPTLLERRAAHRREARERSNACRRLAGDYSELPVRIVIDILADGVLAGTSSAALSRFSTQIHEWLGIEVPATRDREAFLADRNLAPRVAVAAALAELEAEAAQAHYAAGAEWPATVKRHVSRLAELGYHELGEFEKTQLALADPLD